GGQEARHGRQEDRQRASALGLRRGGVPVSACQRTRQEMEAEVRGAARRRQGSGDVGSAAGAHGLPHAAQTRSVRRGAFLERQRAANRYEFLFSVSAGGGACRGLIFAKRGRVCAWRRCWS